MNNSKAMNILINDHRKYAMMLAYKFSIRYNLHGLGRDDIKQLAMIGLMKAAERYDPERGTLATFMRMYVWGSMQRGLYAYRFGPYIQDGTKKLPRFISMDMVAPYMAKIQSNEQCSSERAMELIKHLPEREEMIVRKYYLEDNTYRAIGVAMGVSTQRVQQIHNRAIRRLRKMFSNGELKNGA